MFHWSEITHWNSERQVYEPKVLQRMNSNREANIIFMENTVRIDGFKF